MHRRTSTGGGRGGRAGVALAALLALLLQALGAPARPAAAQGAIIYVSAAARGAGTGLSWADAYSSLQDALAAPRAGAEIWVAAGTYRPTDRGDRSASFQLRSGVAIYGGFAGGEARREERSWSANPTILSGDLAGDDGPGFANSGENSFSVVKSDGVDATAVLDGFIITGGNADGATGNDSRFGGGMFSLGSSPTLANLIIRDNRAGGGGGMLNDHSSPTLTNVVISGNAAGQGGGIYNYRSSPTLANVIISGNRSAVMGGGILQDSGSLTLTNVTISGNRAGQIGGMLSFGASAIQITNSIIWGNQSDYGARSISADVTRLTLRASIVQGGLPARAIDGGGNLDADPRFVEAVPAAPSSGGNLRLQPGSPAIDAGSAPCPASDLDGQPRPQGAGCDIGAFELAAPVTNRAPTALALTNASVAERQAPGTVVGSLSASDPDSGDSHTFSLVGGAGADDNASFSIAGASLVTAMTFDARAKGSLSIRVRATDSGGLFVEQPFTISVTAVNRAPTITFAGGAGCAADGSARATVRVAVSDPDGDLLTIALAPGAPAWAQASINQASGEVSFALTPDQREVRSALVALSVSDGRHSAQTSLGLHVGTQNDNVIDAQTAAGGQFAQVPNVILGLRGQDQLTGGGQADVLCGGEGDNRLAGGEGSDVLEGGNQQDRIEGGAGDDLIFGRDGDNTLSGGDGADTIMGGRTRDTVDGGAGNDTIASGDGDDSLAGGDGDDQLSAGSGNDRLTGGAGADSFDGGNGQDRATDRAPEEPATSIEHFGP